jgi:hypothetical protein
MEVKPRVRQFPNVTVSIWVINQTRWDGMIMDVHTTVNKRRAMELSLNHILAAKRGGEIT